MSVGGLCALDKIKTITLPSGIMNDTHRYLIHIQYLGFRYHGWLKQPGVKTVELMIEKTMVFILGHNDFKILGASRTDALVSACHSVFMLFCPEPYDTKQLLSDLNANLPADIRAVRAEKKDASFNVINSPRIKEYLYLFSHGREFHPFSASLMYHSPVPLDIERMKKGAVLFQGRHNFIRYCTKPGPNTRVERDIEYCRIEDNNELIANFFPETSWLLRIRSRGFMRNQIRLMMGQLLELGTGRITLPDIEDSLTGKETGPLRQIAPASGLILNRIDLD